MGLARDGSSRLVIDNKHSQLVLIGRSDLQHHLAVMTLDNRLHLSQLERLGAI